MNRKKYIDKDLLVISDAEGSLNLFTLSWPVFLQNILFYMMSSVHTILLTEVSEETVAAIGIAMTIINIFTVLSQCPSLGILVHISYALGREDRKAVNALYTVGMILSAAFTGIVSLIIIVFAEKIMSMYHISGETLSYAVWYLRIRVLFSVVYAVNSCIYSVLRCYGKTSVIMVSSVVSNAINILLSFLVVRGYLPFGNKVIGVALAAGMGQVMCLLISIAFLKGKVRMQSGFTLKMCKDILKIGIFSSLVGSLSYQMTVSITTGFTATLGTSAVNTRIFVNNIAMFSPLISIAVSSSNSAMLGRLLGREDYENGYRLVAQNGRIAATGNTVFAILIFLLSEPLLRLFTADPSTIQLGRILLAIDILLEYSRAYNHVYGESALVCGQDVLFSSVTGILSCWFFSVLGSWFLGIYLKLGLLGIYVALSVSEFIRAILYRIRWDSGAWEKML